MEIFYGVLLRLFLFWFWGGFCFGFGGVLSFLVGFLFVFFFFGWFLGLDFLEGLFF